MKILSHAILPFFFYVQFNCENVIIMDNQAIQKKTKSYDSNLVTLCKIHNDLVLSLI